MREGTGLARPFTEPVLVFSRMRGVFAGSRQRKSVEAESEGGRAFEPGRDPGSAGSALAELTGVLGWTEPLAEARLYVEWHQLVGEGIAEHARPVSLVDGKLTLQATSTAWATQLRLMRHDLLVALAEKLPEVTIDQLTVLAPGAPSWKSGPRAVPGRGPRDTYG